MIKDDIVKNTETVISAPVSCRDCRMSALCIPLSLISDELYKLEQVIQHGNPLQARQPVFNSGDKFKAVYAVRSGSVKSFCIDHDGREKVTGFYLPEKFSAGMAWQRISTRIQLSPWRPPLSVKYLSISWRGWEPQFPLFKSTLCA